MSKRFRQDEELSTLTAIPDNVLENELIYRLDYPQIEELCFSSRRFHQLCKRESMLQKKTKIDFPRQYQVKPLNPHLTWFEFYQELYHDDQQRRQHISHLLSRIRFTNQNLKSLLPPEAQEHWTKIAQSATAHSNSFVDFAFLYQYWRYIDIIEAKLKGMSM